VEAIAMQERNEKLQERLAKQEAEAIADLANLEKQHAEQRVQHLAEMLKAKGIDTDEI
jgi:hypothetical protein